SSISAALRAGHSCGSRSASGSRSMSGEVGTGAMRGEHAGPSRRPPEVVSRAARSRRRTAVTSGPAPRCRRGPHRRRGGAGWRVPAPGHCARPCRPDPRCPDRAPRAAAPATRRTRWSRARCRPTGCRSRARTRRPGPRRDRPRRARGWQTCRPPPHRSAAPGAGPAPLRTWPAYRSPDEDGYAESAMADVIVGRFALIDLIAKGGSGSIWRAWDSKAEQVCAAKVLRQRDSADLMRFVREKGVSFDHPHLLTPYGWGAEDEHVVIAMPLVTGGTLESVVKHRGKLAEPAVVVVLEQLLDGLAHIHAEGWIHRDVKPANIMFEPRGRSHPHTRLADFGIAV